MAAQIAYRRFQERIRTLMGLEEGSEPVVQRLVSRAGLVEVGLALGTRGPLAGLSEEDLFPIVSRVHRRRRLFLHSYMRIPVVKSMDEFHKSFWPPILA